MRSLRYLYSFVFDFVRFEYGVSKCSFLFVCLYLFLMLSSCICHLLPAINFGKYLSIIMSNLSSILLFSSLFVTFQLHVSYIFWNCPTVYKIFCSFFKLFSPYISVLGASIDIYSSLFIIFWLCQVCWWTHKDIFLSVIILFYFDHFILILS